MQNLSGHTIYHSRVEIRNNSINVNINLLKKVQNPNTNKKHSGLERDQPKLLLLFS